MSKAAQTFRLLRTGDESFGVMLDAIAAAKQSITLETYIYGDDAVGREFLTALREACGRGVRVRVLVDAWGCFELNTEFFQPLIVAGGEARWFNPLRLDRFAFRNHRKALVCDDRVAFIGGFNIASEYAGDGRLRGWCDTGLQFEGPLAVELGASFETLWELADFRHKFFAQLRKSGAKQRRAAECCELLFSGPGRGFNPIKRALKRDLAHAPSIRIIAAYFCPPLRMRRALMRAAREGRRVQLILPAKSDVPLSQSASRSLYRRFLKAGVEIYEYQPQILHSKLVIAGDAVFLGSSNLDPRSLDFNYELMLRAEHAPLTDDTNELFDAMLLYCRRITLEEWKRSRSWCERLRQRWAYFVVAQFDHFVSARQMKRLKQ